MKCVVCGKPWPGCEKPKHSCFTCSQSCAGKLAQSVKLTNILRKQFDNKEKNKIRQYIFNKFVKPSLICEEPVRKCFNILDFWGGGLFSDYVIDHRPDVKNHFNIVNLYEVEKDKKLFPALKKYAREKNHYKIVKNHVPNVIPICSSLAKFVQSHNVKNQRGFDLIWLDYCEAGGRKEKDIEYASRILKEGGVLAITCAWPLSSKHTINHFVDKYFPSFSLVKEKEYQGKKENGNACSMGVYVYKKKYKIRKEVYRECQTSYKIPSWLNFRTA